MARRTTQPRPAAPEEALPPDIATMRATTARVFGPDDEVLPPSAAEVDILTATLRGHLELLAPEIQSAVGARPKSVAQHCALACVGEARGKLRAGPQPGLEGAVAYARRLARVLNALCDHYERIGPGGETREQAARRRLGEHCARCPTCQAVDDQGANLDLPCAESDRLYDEWRQARRGGGER